MQLIMQELEFEATHASIVCRTPFAIKKSVCKILAPLTNFRPSFITRIVRFLPSRVVKFIPSFKSVEYSKLLLTTWYSRRSLKPSVEMEDDWLENCARAEAVLGMKYMVSGRFVIFVVKSSRSVVRKPPLVRRAIKKESLASRTTIGSL